LDLKIDTLKNDATKKIEEIKNELTRLQNKREQLLERLYEDSISSDEEDLYS